MSPVASNGSGPRTTAVSPSRRSRPATRPAPRRGTHTVITSPSPSRVASAGVSCVRSTTAPSVHTPRSRSSKGSMGPTVRPGMRRERSAMGSAAGSREP